MNKEVKFILQRLHDAGYEAYLVGGCVRDKLMNRDIHDYDICTSALPQEVEKVFEDYRIIETGLKHGTVTVVMQDDNYEITTFRADGDYSDGRHPDSVSFVRNLRDDLLRRDFTMNAIAFDGNDYVDLFDGAEDIHNKTIRCVGDANARFQEDALRILRAMRFSSQLGFVIDDETKKAMHTHKDLIKKVSCERITSELQKMIVGKGIYDVLHEFRDIIAVFIPEFETCFDFDQKNDWHVYDVYEHIIHSVQNIDDDRILRLAMLFHDIGKPATFFVDDNGVGHFYGHGKVSHRMCIDIMRRLKFDNDTIDKVAVLVECHDREIVASKKSVRKLFSQIGAKAAFDLLKVKCADNLAQNRIKVCNSGSLDHICDVRAIMDDVLNNDDCTDKKQLAITGNDLRDLGLVPSPVYSEIFRDLLDKVMGDELSNSKDDLLGYVRTHYIFKIVADVNAEEYGKRHIEKYGKNMDDLEFDIQKEIEKTCIDLKMPKGTQISVKVNFYELDMKTEHCILVYSFNEANPILVEVSCDSD